MQFCMVPMNLMTKYKKIHAVNTGQWSKKAIAEAKKFGEVNVVASSEDKTFSYIPELSADMFTPDADYVHITSNNTIYGTKYTKLPPVGGLPPVSYTHLMAAAMAFMSSLPSSTSSTCQP